PTSFTFAASLSGDALTGASAGGVDLYYDTTGQPASATLRKVTNRSGEVVFNPPVATGGRYYPGTLVQPGTGFQPPPDEAVGQAAATSGDLTQYVFVSAPGTSQTLTFTYDRLGLIEGRVFSDLDGDGQRQQQDPGMPGVQVYLDENGNSQLDPGEPQQLTDA